VGSEWSVQHNRQPTLENKRRFLNMSRSWLTEFDSSPEPVDCSIDLAHPPETRGASDPARPTEGHLPDANDDTGAGRGTQRSNWVSARARSNVKLVENDIPLRPDWVNQTRRVTWGKGRPARSPSFKTSRSSVPSLSRAVSTAAAPSSRVFRNSAMGRSQDRSVREGDRP
jgi:hypothetical protein